MKTTYRYGKTLWAFAVLLAAVASMGAAITYQARVQDATGADIDGPVTVGFRVYGSLAGATVLWGETQNLTADKGIVSVELGAVNPLPANLFDNPELYMGVTVAGESEMTPRRRMVSIWKAMSANRASGKAIKAGGGTMNVSSSSSALTTITFAEPFSAPPVVMLGAPDEDIGGVSFVPVRVTDVTATGCTAHFTALDGATATGTANFDWIAIGE